MGDEGLYLVLGLFIGFILTALFAVFVVEAPLYDSIEELGQSICEEEYGMHYEDYEDKVLKCKPIKESYDGISIEVKVSQKS